MQATGSPDQIIKDLGGCGNYQMLISVVTHVIKLFTCWSVSSMVILLYTPPWRCLSAPANGSIVNTSSLFNNDEPYILWDNDSKVERATLNDSLGDLGSKKCSLQNGQTCSNFVFEGSSVVSEFDLVCDYAYAPSVIMSVKNAGSLCGNLLAGQVSDLFGRKRPFFGSVALMMVALFVGYAANHWTLFAATRFFVGFGASAFMTAKYSLLSEFTLSSHRAWIIGFPSWPMAGSAMAGVAYLLRHNWKHLQLTIALIGFPCLLAWWIIPESFRWYLSHGRQEEAEKVLQTVAKFNKKPCISLKQLEELNLTDGEDNDKGDRKYSFFDIFKSRYLTKLTLLLATVWFTMGFVSYGIFFGIQALSGDLYMNVFLFAVTGIPSKAIAIWLENRFGRKKTSILCYVVTGFGGLAAGIVYYIDTPYRGALINGFALVANIGITTAWGPVQTITIELYPTVIRSIGFGTLSVLGRLGAIVGPQIVYLSTIIPGLMYFVCGGLSIISIVCLSGLSETNNMKLNDKLSQAKTVP